MFACSCSTLWFDSFNLTTKYNELVALVKVISFDEYLERPIYGFEGAMPYSMTVEIIKKYKGKEQRDSIQIFGDNGMLCRPYLSDFKLNEYYLIAPIALNNDKNTGYDFFICRTDFLKVDMTKNIAYGKFSLLQNQINLTKFKRSLKYQIWYYVTLGALPIFLIIVLIIKRRNEKRNTNKT